MVASAFLEQTVAELKQQLNIEHQTRTRDAILKREVSNDVLKLMSSQSFLYYLLTVCVCFPLHPSIRLHCASNSMRSWRQLSNSRLTATPSTKPTLSSASLQHKSVRLRSCFCTRFHLTSAGNLYVCSNSVYVSTFCLILLLIVAVA